MGIERQHFTVLLPKILKKPTTLFKEPKLLEDAIPLIGFLTPFPQLITGPILMNLEYRIKKTSPSERKDFVVQELTSQGITTITHTISFLTAGFIARRFLPKVNPKIFYKNSSASKNGETLASLLGGVLGGAFLMPILSAATVSKFKEKKSKKNDANGDSSDKNHQAKSNMPSLFSYKSNSLSFLC
jgi:hypothetical protein